MTNTLFTIYLFIVVTLVASAGMTLWERNAQPARRRFLGTCAAGYAVLATGCVIATTRTHIPGITGAVLSNLVMLCGYMVVLDAVAALDGRRHRGKSALLLAGMAALWAWGGAQWAVWTWLYAAAVPIAIVCLATTWEAWRSPPLRTLRSRNVLIAVTGFHGVVYAARALVLPAIVARFGQDAIELSSTLTLYTGVLYSVVLPMVMLALVREEADAGLVRLATTDHLTELGNRRWFFSEGADMIAAAPGDLALLAFDIDHFKSINDRFGHATGDKVLKSFALILRDVVGPHALLARIGGEEFAIMLPGYDGAGARRVGQAVIDSFADSAVLCRSGVAVSATVSVGLAELVNTGRDLATLLGLADRALYAAKTLGRNRLEPAMAALVQPAMAVA